MVQFYEIMSHQSAKSGNINTSFSLYIGDEIRFKKYLSFFQNSSVAMALFCYTLVTRYSCDTLSYNAISARVTIHKQATWHHFVLFVLWYHKVRF